MYVGVLTLRQLGPHIVSCCALGLKREEENVFTQQHMYSGYTVHGPNTCQSTLRPHTHCTCEKIDNKVTIHIPNHLELLARISIELCNIFI